MNRLPYKQSDQDHYTRRAVCVVCDSDPERFCLDYCECNIEIALQTTLKVQSRRVLSKVTWKNDIKACNYYARHLQSVKKVVQSFDPDDAVAIQICQELLNDRTIEKEVMDIKPNFGYLPDAIIQLEKSGVELVEQINIMRTIVNKLSAVEGEVGKRVGEKMNRVLIKNDGYGILSRISDVLTKTCPKDVIQHANLIDVSCFKYSPTVSADVKKMSFLATEDVQYPVWGIIQGASEITLQVERDGRVHVAIDKEYRDTVSDTVLDFKRGMSQVSCNACKLNLHGARWIPLMRLVPQGPFPLSGIEQNRKVWPAQILCNGTEPMPVAV
ncbi:hypothetical protein ANN_27269 [Periplaneta americana]|uniref:Uncharacterized protein n=1 Tax=Periplaneta americana TaxID=6978 RepID=A0ABQ8RXU4_PERAM|nr:hypothetical protein ANN_27269 [Periplaneta americana]